MTLEELDRISQETTYRCVNVSAESIQALTESIDRHFPPKIGRPMNVADTGEPYREFYEVAYCRDAPFDMEVAKRAVLDSMVRHLSDYLMYPEDETHTVYWRIRPEEDWIDQPQVIAYADSGPDVDFITQRPCLLDKGWKKYQVYCRLLRSGKPAKVAA